MNKEITSTKEDWFTTAPNWLKAVVILSFMVAMLMLTFLFLAAALLPFVLLFV